MYNHVNAHEKLGEKVKKISFNTLDKFCSYNFNCRVIMKYVHSTMKNIHSHLKMLIGMLNLNFMSHREWLRLWSYEHCG